MMCSWRAPSACTCQKVLAQVPAEVRAQAVATKEKKKKLLGGLRRGRQGPLPKAS